MSRNEQAYPRECVEAEQLVRSAIMRIINDCMATARFTAQAGTRQSCVVLAGSALTRAVAGVFDPRAAVPVGKRQGDPVWRSGLAVGYR
jgi:hypothetical protein